jgi:superfamily II DNA helicase RecQ
LLCSICKCAIHFSKAISHLKLHLTDFQLDNSSYSIHLFSLDIHSFEKSLSLLQNTSNLSAFSELSLIKTGLLCVKDDCQSLFISKQNIARHLSSTHNIKRKKQQSQFIQSCFLQSLQTNNMFFQVNMFSSSSSTSSVSESNQLDDQDLINNYLDSIHAKQRAQNAELVLLSKTTVQEHSAFQNQAKYTHFLRNKNLQDCVKLLELDFSQHSNSSEKTQFLSLVIDYLLIAGESKLQILNRTCLQILNSFNAEKITLRKFQALQESDRLKKYSLIFKQFLFFLLSCYSLHSLSSSFSLTSSMFSLTSQMKHHLKELNSLMNEVQKQETDDYLISSDSQSDSDSEYEELNNQQELDSVASLTDEELDDNYTARSYANTLKKVKNKVKKQFIAKSFSFSFISSAAKIISSLFILCFQYKTEATFHNIINCYFAVLSINSHDQTLYTSTKMSQLYSHFIYCSQLFVVNYCCQLHVSSSYYSEHHRLSFLFEQFMKSYFHNSSETGLAEILSLRAYAFKVNKETSTETYDIKMLDSQTVKIEHLILSVNSLTVLFHKSILKAADVLFKHLILNVHFMSELNVISLSQAAEFENFSNSALHANFLSQNTQLRRYETFLQQKCFTDKNLFKKFFYKKSDKLFPQLYEITSYFLKVTQFLKLLLFLIHVTSGAPSRGTEIVSLMHANSMRSQRNLFLDTKKHLFLIKSRYSKTFSITQREQNAIRYLPHSVSYLLLIYLSVVLPFIQFLNLSIDDKESDAKYLLFFTRKNMLKSRHLSQQMKSLSALYLGQKLNVSLYRHVIHTFIRESMKEHIFDDIEDQNSIENIAARQMHHSLHTANFMYGRQDIHLSNFSLSSQDAFLSFSLKYHDFFQLNAISLAHFQSSFLHSALIKTDQSSSFFSASTDALKTRKKHALSISSNTSSSTVKKVKLSELSTAISFLHQKSNFANLSADSSDYQISDLDQHGKIALIDKSQSADFSLFSTDVLSLLLQDFFQDSSISFKSSFQRLAFQYILQKKSCLTVILPTAGGKSLLFLLNASLSTSQTTIVIVPLISLKHNLKKRAQEFNISCSFWEEKRKDNFDSLILVSVESVNNSTFISFVQHLFHSNALDCIVFDECHMIVLTASYRFLMHRLKQLRMIQTQFIFLTATLSLENEKKLNDMMLLSNNLTIRASISQKNIHYSVRSFRKSDDDSKLDDIMQYIHSFQSEHEGKIILYSMTKSFISFVQSHYSDLIACYHADLTTEQKEQELNDFLTAKKSIIIATSALSAGFDFSDISLVIHIQSSWSITEFIQESGRLSRQNQKGFSVIFTTEKEKQISRTDNQERLYMKQYLSETICRRRLLKLIFDNAVIDHCESQEAICDLCESRQIERNSIAQATSAYYQQVTEHKESLLQHLTMLKGLCFSCFFENNLYAFFLNDSSDLHLQHCYDHSFSTCQFKTHCYDELQVLNNLFLKKDSACFKCFLPTVICKNYQEKNNKCYFSNIIAFFFIHLWALTDEETFSYKSDFLTTDLINHSDFKVACKLFQQVNFDFFDTECLFPVIVFVDMMNQWQKSTDKKEEKKNVKFAN